ncbi:MAG TPA: hypothetical protein EYP40_03805, partial [Chromatiales bacterium]|nr:hypothetical protein [Chromatiales bacterium]
MAKVSMIQREIRREKMVKKYANKRAELKAIIKNPETPFEERIAAQEKLQQLIEVSRALLDSHLFY